MPVRRHVPGHRFPVVTAALIAVNVVLFAFELTLPRYGMTLRGFYAKAGAVPYELAHGLDVPPRDLVPWWATPVTGLFVPGGWPYLVVDLLYLWMFGAHVEVRLGRLRYLGLYLACGIVAAATQTAVDTGSVAPVIGPGGAVAGVLGAYLVLTAHARTLTLGLAGTAAEIPAWALLGVWFGLQAIAGVLSLGHAVAGLALFADIGGLIAGMALGFALAGGSRCRRLARRA